MNPGTGTRWMRLLPYSAMKASEPFIEGLFLVYLELVMWPSNSRYTSI